MEKEEQKLERVEVEEEEAVETTPLVRKSRNRDGSKIFAISDVDGEVSNGVSLTINGHTIQSGIAVDGAENEELIIPAAENQKIEESDWVFENESEAINGEHKIVGSDGVLENESEAINGEKKNSENLVFHDKVEGIWKCRICTWTYGNGSVCVDHIQNHRGNVKTLNFVSQGLGIISAPICKTLVLEGPAHTKFDVSSLDPAIQFNGTSVINTQYKEESEENGISSSNVQPSDSSSQEGVDSTSTYIIRELILKGPVKYDVSSLDPSIQFNGTSVISNQYKEEIEKNGVSSSNVSETDVINEDDLEITELDVERVIQKQTTHDLFCPNCKSCITKRVILSKRKRRIRIPDEEVKRPKTGTVTVSPVEEGEIGNDDAQIPTIDEDERERGPDIFRCLSCFSIFIPTGDGFKLFRIFGDKSGKENVGDEQAPNVKKNWFSNIFKPNQEITVEQGSSSSETNILQVSSAIPSSDPAHESARAPASEGLEGTTGKTTTHEGGDKTTYFSYGYHLKLPLLVDATKSADQQAESKSSREVDINRDSVQPPTLPMNSADKDAVHLSPPSVSTATATDADGTMNISVSIPHNEQDVEATIVTTSVLENKNVDSRSSDNGEIYPAEVPQQQLITTTTFEFHHDEPLRTGISSTVVDATAGQVNDTRITIDTHPPLSSHIGDCILPPAVAPTASQSEAPISSGVAREERKIEVIKSIVYGGLAETMTSLSVVSSAVGGGAATLNVLAMGAANLIGGLFIISHNLWDLRCDCVEEQLSNQITEQTDRYKQLLGRRQNFALHAVVAIISYIVFGLVPPVVYGFSFRESDDKQLKLVVVAAAALVCILVLAVGKAYVQIPPKPYLKTVATFLILGIMISGMSYAAGGLVENLLEKLGVFEPSSAAPPNLLVQEMRPVGSGWAFN